MYKIKLQLVLALIWAIDSVPPNYNWTQSPIQQVSQTPKTPPPPNTKPGGGLDPSNVFCKKTKQPLTPLIPRQNAGLTTSARPTFWFYIPYVSEDIKRGEFSLVTQDDKTVIYETPFQLPETSGIVKISLPLSSKSAL